MEGVFEDTLLFFKIINQIKLNNKMAKNVPVDKVYKLKIGSPLSYTLASRNHPRFPLMWFDEKNNVNRALRYATNQKSLLKMSKMETQLLSLSSLKMAF